MKKLTILAAFCLVLALITLNAKSLSSSKEISISTPSGIDQEIPPDWKYDCWWYFTSGGGHELICDSEYTCIYKCTFTLYWKDECNEASGFPGC